MKKSILEIYALAVCFATVVCLVIALGVASYNIIGIFKPEFTMSVYEYDKYQSNDAFWKDYSKNEQRPPEGELTLKRMENYKLALHSEYRDAWQGLIKATLVVIFDVIFFIIHWRIARRAREMNSR